MERQRLGEYKWLVWCENNKIASKYLFRFVPKNAVKLKETLEFILSTLHNNFVHKKHVHLI